MPTYRMDLAYDGSSFHGYAAQPNLRTVQGELETALAPHTAGAATQVAGRTDKGVHATAQVVSFVSRDINTAYVVESLNRQLAPEIAVHRLIQVDNGFDARRSATGRAYRYRILNSPIHDPLLARTTWHVKEPLDVQLMNKAARYFVGEHDFAAFCRRYRDRSMVRRLDWAVWRRTNDLIDLSIGAAAFCHQMVRSIAALCVAVGHGSIDPSTMPEILESGDRSLTPGVAPAHGLTLVAVSYHPDPLPRPSWATWA
ncbi:MAG: tRNA pseudouridine(38-40) synthase TruA [Acidimicrobiia bacterium]